VVAWILQSGSARSGPGAGAPCDWDAVCGMSVATWTTRSAIFCFKVCLA